MNIKIEHGFLHKAHDINKLFTGVNKLSTFMSRLNKQSEQDPLNYASDKYRGDGFEFFIEMLLKTHSCDNRIGIMNYTPVQEDDNGVDGFGINVSGEKSTVQIKYRSNVKTFLTGTGDSLGNLISDSVIKHNVYSSKEEAELIRSHKLAYRYYVFTTAQGLHQYTDTNFFKGLVKCYGYNDIKNLVHNNNSFWNTVSTAITDNLTKFNKSH